MDAADRAVADIAELIERYLAHVRRAGAPSSAVTYGYQLHPLRRWLLDRGIRTSDQLREGDLEDWQNLLQSRQLAPKSRSLAATALRGWLRWMIEREYINARLLRAVSSVRTPRGRARPIPEQDLLQLLDFLGPRRPNTSLWDLRDRALFWFLLTTGARISEALQVQRAAYTDVVVTQKGGRQKRLRIPPSVVEMVREYLDARTDSLPELWVVQEPGHGARPLRAQAANGIWRRIARQFGLQRWSSHRLRDSSATLLALKRLPTHMIADHLGHADLRTVMKYIEIAEEQRGDVLSLMEQLVAEKASSRPAQRWVKLRGRPDRRPKR